MLSQRCHMSGACALGKRQHRPQSLSCSCKLLCVQLPADCLQNFQVLVLPLHVLQCCATCKKGHWASACSVAQYFTFKLADRKVLP